jgi:biotin carboxyl carrier protein
LGIEVNGNTYKVHIADGYDQMVEEMGLLVNTSQKVNEIKAPMPGLILDILVQVGQEITEGTPLLVLSAMKMENIILSQGDGVVKSIEVNKDDAVEKGQLIIEME